MGEMKKLKLKEYDVIYHLSDADLDGYGSQHFLNYYNKKFINTKIVFSNARRMEITTKIKNVFSEIYNRKDDKILFLITDLSLEESQVKKINNFKSGNKNIDLDIQLLDHHITGLKNSENNDWYHMDINNCSAMLTYKWLEKNIERDEVQDVLSKVIQSYDLWKEKDEYFDIGVFLSNVITKEIRYPENFDDQERNERLFMIDQLSNLIFENSNIRKLEENLYNLKNDYVIDKLENGYIYKDLSYKDKKNIYLGQIMEGKNVIFNAFKEIGNKDISIFSKDMKKYMNEYAFKIGNNKYLNNGLKNQIKNKKDEIKFNEKKRLLYLIEKILLSRNTLNQIEKIGMKSSLNLFSKDIVKNIKMPYMFKELEYKLKEFMKEQLNDFIIEKRTINEVEKESNFIEEKFIYLMLPKDISGNKNMSKDTKKIKMYFEYSKLNSKNDYSIINIDGLKSKVVFNMGIGVFQVWSSDYLRFYEKDVDFMIHISKNGAVSLRTRKNGINVAEISSKFFGGGGHIQASGGKIDVKKDIENQMESEFIVKNKIKSIEEIINSINL